MGQTLHRLLQELQPGYGSQAAYQVLERLFSENFKLVEMQVHPKANDEIRSDCLQSVDDLEATYRTKGNAHYKGYVANLTETCDPTNELQLITKVQVASNNVDDSQLLADALPNLKARTNLETMITDGGYGGEASDTALQTAQVNLIQTAIRGLQSKHRQAASVRLQYQIQPRGQALESYLPTRTDRFRPDHFAPKSVCRSLRQCYLSDLPIARTLSGSTREA